MGLTIFIIRHAEKPEEGSNLPAFDEDGCLSKRCLTIRGWQRAGAWAALFQSGSSTYLRPDLIYATNPDRDALGNVPSRRPYLTAVPLSQRLALPIETKWLKGQEAELAKALMNKASEDAVALVCWEHKKIGETLLPSLFNGNVPPDVLKKWDSSRYDVVLRLEWSQERWTFQQLFPRLLVGDSAVPM